MHELYELKEKLMSELKDYARKGEMNAVTLDVVDKLAHTIKNLCKIIDDYEYSEENRGGSYIDGRQSFENMDGRQSFRGGMSYARGRGRQARRDSMGRYSSGGGLVEELRELMEEAPDQRTKMEFQKLIDKMERMG